MRAETVSRSDMKLIERQARGCATRRWDGKLNVNYRELLFSLLPVETKQELELILDE